LEEILAQRKDGESQADAIQVEEGDRTAAAIRGGNNPGRLGGTIHHIIHHILPV
jgi:hypothetical protein